MQNAIITIDDKQQNAELHCIIHITEYNGVFPREIWVCPLD